MIHHLEVSTLTALVCAAAALALRRSSAALRHFILLLGILRFAVYTPWLTSAGERLARFVPAHHAPAPRLVHVTVRLLLPDLPAPGRRRAPVPRDWTQWKQFAWWLWYAGAALGVGSLLGRLMRPMRPVREATFWERDGFLQTAGAFKAAGAFNNVELWIVAAGQVPGAQGWLRPRVLLPDGLTNTLSEEEMGTVMAHELAHLRRRDPLIAVLVRAIASVFWFHPVLWWMERRMLAERETACDEMVLAGGALPEDYAAGIAKVCRTLLGGCVPGNQPGYASFTGANLAERLEHILSPISRRSWPRRLGLIPAALAIVAMLIPVASGLLQAQTEHDRAAALLQAALLLDGTGRTSEAVPLYKKLIQDDPDNSVALNNLAYILAEKGGSLDVALTYAERAHDLKPASIEIDDTLGWIFVKRGMPDRAILALRDPVLKSPNTRTFRSHMAQALDERLSESVDAPDWMRDLRSVIFATSPESEARLRELLESITK